MKSECCTNCSYFRIEAIRHYSGDYDKEVYHCDHHDLHNGEVSWPSEQYCPSHYHTKSSEREKKINKILEI